MAHFEILIPDLEICGFPGEDPSDPMSIKGDIDLFLQTTFEDIFPIEAVIKTDVGRGADLPSLVIQFLRDYPWIPFLVGASHVFLKGEKILANLNAWVEIGQKTKKLLERLKENGIDKPKIDSGLVLMLALENWMNDEHIHERSLDTISIERVDGGLLDSAVANVDKFPEAYYVITIKGWYAYTYIISINGVIEAKFSRQMYWAEF